MIWIVGDPRTRTSLMMEVTEAGGVPVRFTTPRSGPLNPHGCFEDNEACNDRTRLRRLRDVDVALKVFPPAAIFLLRKAIIPTHILVPRRPLAATLASWDRAFPDRERAGGITRDQIGVVLDQAVALARQAHARILAVDGDRLIDSPREVCQEIAAFLGRDLDIDAMTAIPDRAHSDTRRAA